ncbi:MAG: hypothetical protein E7Z69_08480 [Thermoplasmata archaeon]|nr:hypothetical protein [Thermoplasmata archaeon]
MIPLQKSLYEINRGAEDYELYLKEIEGLSESQAEKVSLALIALYWQAGEQMEYLHAQIDSGIRDGKQFTMLVGFAYSILDCLEAVAESACIGTKGDNGYIIRTNTRFIRTIRLYGKRSEGKDTNDFEIFRFLRSFICAHPLETNYASTSDGFIPGSFAYCKFVDYIPPQQRSLLGEPDGVDFYVQVFSGSNSDNGDFYLNSSEIWQYVDHRYGQLVEEIHKAVQERSG